MIINNYIFTLHHTPQTHAPLPAHVSSILSQRAELLLSFSLNLCQLHRCSSQPALHSKGNHLRSHYSHFKPENLYFIKTSWDSNRVPTAQWKQRRRSCLRGDETAADRTENERLELHIKIPDLFFSDVNWHSKEAAWLKRHVECEVWSREGRWQYGSCL